jgi:hypothetical protein
MTTKLVCTVLGILLGAVTARAQEQAAQKAAAPELQSVVTDCVSFQDKKLTVKFRLDKNFRAYASSRFAYPKQGGIKTAQVGETYLFTFLEDEAAHNVKSAQRLEEDATPAEISNRSLIGKVVDVVEKAVVVQWKQDESIDRFFSREHSFPIRSGREFSQGQVVKIVFGKDNRHCQGYIVLDEGKKDR